MKETKVLAQTARKSAFKRPEDVNNSKITKMKTRSRGQHKGSDDGAYPDPRKERAGVHA
jgi:hypothetical protein